MEPWLLPDTPYAARGGGPSCASSIGPRFLGTGTLVRRSITFGVWQMRPYPCDLVPAETGMGPKSRNRVLPRQFTDRHRQTAAPFFLGPVLRAALGNA
jgi:hypothetical protein